LQMVNVSYHAILPFCNLMTISRMATQFYVLNKGVLTKNIR
jgi:hypothetical protein